MKKLTLERGVSPVEYYLKLCRIFLIQYKAFAKEAEMFPIEEDSRRAILEIDSILKSLNPKPLRKTAPKRKKTTT